MLVQACLSKQGKYVNRVHKNVCKSGRLLLEAKHFVNIPVYSSNFNSIINFSRWKTNDTVLIFPRKQGFPLLLMSVCNPANCIAIYTHAYVFFVSKGNENFYLILFDNSCKQSTTPKNVFIPLRMFKFHKALFVLIKVKQMKFKQSWLNTTGDGKILCITAAYCKERPQ